jgi:hypothetical protein
MQNPYELYTGMLLDAGARLKRALLTYKDYQDSWLGYGGIVFKKAQAEFAPHAEIAALSKRLRENVVPSPYADPNFASAVTRQLGPGATFQLHEGSDVLPSPPAKGYLYPFAKANNRYYCRLTDTNSQESTGMIVVGLSRQELAKETNLSETALRNIDQTMEHNKANSGEANQAANLEQQKKLVISKKATVQPDTKMSNVTTLSAETTAGRTVKGGKKI